MSKHIHLIGIGGIGMSGIAHLLVCRGLKVSGSDLKRSRLTDELKKLGASIYIGHNRENLKGADLVVYSSAIKEDNPEMQEAKEKGILLIRRAEALADLMRDETVIAISGSHGKTTTTSLASCLLMSAGLRPTVAIGGILKNIGNNVCMGDGRFFVAEADESDASFLHYRPTYSVITNIDREHLDYYRDFDAISGAFREFIRRTRPEGCVFSCADDANLMKIISDYRGRHVLFGFNDNAHISAKNIRIDGLHSQFDCVYRGELFERFSLPLGGRHNISNALAVIALGIELGIEGRYIKDTLANYQGAGRRIEVKMDNGKYLLIDDYAHHPTEIKATLSAVKNLRKRVIAVFQPHRYTRTKLLLDEFAGSFDLADYVIITDIYPASETPLRGISGESVYEKIKEYAPDKNAFFIPKDEIVKHLTKIMQPDDLVITLGAGDIAKVCDELVERLKNQG